MVFVAAVGEKKIVHGRPKERIRAIFENGTESEMFLRSLSSQLYDDGFIVASSDYEDLKNTLLDDDEVTGYIYILSSLSNDPNIQNTKDLHKIGYSTTLVDERIKDAAKDPTYLMAPVKKIETYVCANTINPQKVEYFLHRFFAGVALDINIIDGNGKDYRPREWFCVPLPVIRQAIRLLMSKDIYNYTYDVIGGSIMERK